MAADRQRRFELLWDAHFEAVLAYALRRSDREPAREAAAETFLVAWRRLDEVPEGAALPWLLGVCRRVIANQRRGQRRAGALLERLSGQPAAAAPDPAERLGDDLAVRRAFAILPAIDRETLALVAWEGLPPREAARAMGCSAAIFSGRLFRARRRLERALRAGEAPPAPAPLGGSSEEAP